MMRPLSLLLLVGTLHTPLFSGDKQAASAREALQPFNDLVGVWRGTGIPSGTREEQQKGFWTETLECEWQFKGGDAWIKIVFDKGKYYTSGELRYLPGKGSFELVLQTLSKEKVSFIGKLQNKVLALDRTTDKDVQRLVFTLLHPNRFLYRYEVRPAEKTFFSKVYQVGATKEGVPFATGDGKPECIVSGGLGTMAVSYKGQTYYVCCGGCRTEFLEDPEKYIKEYEAKKSKSKGK